MAAEHTEKPDPSEPSPGDEIPAVEDVYAAEPHPSEPPSEDEPALLDSTVRAIGGAPAEDGGTDQPAPTAPGTADSEDDDAGDADSVQEEPGDAEEKAKPSDWEFETSAHRIAVELKHIERDIRALLEGRDGRRKRRLTGTRRWLELQDDLLSWHGTGRFDSVSFARIEQLTTRRHYLYRRLHFLAGTRPGWNS